MEQLLLISWLVYLQFVARMHAQFEILVRQLRGTRRKSISNGATS